MTTTPTPRNKDTIYPSKIRKLTVVVHYHGDVLHENADNMSDSEILEECFGGSIIDLITNGDDYTMGDKELAEQGQMGHGYVYNYHRHVFQCARCQHTNKYPDQD